MVDCLTEKVIRRMKMKELKKVIGAICVFAMALIFAPALVTNAEGSPSVFYSTITSPNQFQQKIDADVKASSVDVINTAWTGKAGAHKIVVNQSGWLFIKGFSNEEGYGNITLYTNAALTSQLKKGYTNELIACYVNPGTYYYQVSRWNGFEEGFTTTTYVGFMPSSARIKVQSITYNSAKTAAKVTFVYDKNYVTDLLSGGTIRVLQGTSVYQNIADEDFWKTEDRKNALNTSSITITKNGNYSARIAGYSDDYYCDTHFTIKGLTKAPAVVTCKITYKTNGGNNSSKNVKTYKSNKGTIKLYNPTRKNYVFKGWYTEKNFKHKVTSIKASSKKNYTLYAKWQKVSVSKVSGVSAKRTSKSSMKVSFKAVSGAKGYQIVYAKNSKFKSSKTVNLSGKSKKITSLKKGTYYVKVRAYKTDSTGKKVYGKYSTTKKVKVK